MADIIELFKKKYFTLEMPIGTDSVVFEFRKDPQGNFHPSNDSSHKLCDILLQRSTLTSEDIENLKVVFKNVKISPLTLVE